MTKPPSFIQVLADTAGSPVDSFGLTARSSWWIRWLPVFIVAPFLPLVLTPRTRQFFHWFVGEGRPVELITFVSMMLATYVGVRLALHLYQQGTPPWVWLFYAFFTFGIFVTGMEEIAWGQWFLHFQTPEFWASVNEQQETTLHNIGALQGHTEYFRALFVVGGIAGLLLNRVPAFAQVAMPPVLWSWMLVMGAHVAVDIANDYLPIRQKFFVDRFSEVIEMMIGLVAYIYLRLNANKLGVADRRSFLLRRALW